MRLHEWIDKNLYVSKDLKVLDEDTNEYRNKYGSLEYLEISNRLFERVNDWLDALYKEYFEEEAGFLTFEQWYNEYEKSLLGLIRHIIHEEVLNEIN